jgi:hypothetical protein
MRRTAVLVVMLGASLLAGCFNPGGPIPDSDMKAWTDRLEHVTPPPSPPPLARELLNTAIRTGVPVVCPALTSQADPQWQPFVTATCAAIVASDDPFTTTTQTLPALCAGDPPLGATIFPNLAVPITATCPVLVKLIPLLGLTQYVPLF